MDNTLNAPSKEDVMELLTTLVSELDNWDLEEMEMQIQQ